MEDLLSARKGNITTLAVAAALARKGEVVLFPFGDCERYDIALDRAGALYRIQCKTGRLRDEVVRFNTCSRGKALDGGRRARRTYRGDIEAFGVYCCETSDVFIVPVDAIRGETECWLRMTPTKSGQKRNLNDGNVFKIT